MAVALSVTLAPPPGLDDVEEKAASFGKTVTRLCDTAMPQSRPAHPSGGVLVERGDCGAKAHNQPRPPRSPQSPTGGGHGAGCTGEGGVPRRTERPPRDHQ